MSEQIDESNQIARYTLPEWFTAAMTVAVAELTRATIECEPGAFDAYRARVRELKEQLAEVRRG